jgi:hypothetical protein
MRRMTHQLSSLGVMAFCPVVASASLTEDEIVWSKQIPERSIPDSVHGSGLEVDKNSAGDVLVVHGLQEVSVR